jgi:hypothetical protein
MRHFERGGLLLVHARRCDLFSLSAFRHLWTPTSTRVVLAHSISSDKAVPQEFDCDHATFDVVANSPYQLSCERARSLLNRQNELRSMDRGEEPQGQSNVLLIVGIAADWRAENLHHGHAGLNAGRHLHSFHGAVRPRRRQARAA